MLSKLTVVRVVTAPYVVPWHLGNTLSRITVDFDVIVVGQNVSLNSKCFPDVQFVDMDINRKERYFSDALALLALCRFLVKRKPHIVHSIMPKAGLLTAIAGFICRVPVRVHTFTGQIWVGRSAPYRYLYWTMDWLITRMNTTCLTDSRSQSDFLFRHGISKAGVPLPVLGSGSLTGVDLLRFSKETVLEPARLLTLELGLDERDFVFSFIARKTRAKGAIDILQAFSRVRLVEPRVKLLFVGPDEDGEIARLAHSNPELFTSVIDVGQVSNHEVYLAVTHVLCLPSYREGFGSIVIDAASMGVPTIGSRIPGLVDAIVDGDTGVLFKQGDINELVKAMLGLCSSRELCQTMGRMAGRRAGDLFSADVLYAALKEFYLSSAAKTHNTCSKVKVL